MMPFAINSWSKNSGKDLFDSEYSTRSKKSKTGKKPTQVEQPKDLLTSESKSEQDDEPAYTNQETKIEKIMWT